MSKMLTAEKFVYRLLFTRDDDLDLLQVMFLLAILFFFIAFGLAGSGIWTVSAPAWAIFKWVFTVLAVCGTPTWIAVLIANKFGGASAAASTAGQETTFGGQFDQGSSNTDSGKIDTSTTIPVEKDEGES